MNSGRAARVGLRLATGLVLAFVYLPLTIVVLYAFNKSGTNAWPPSGFTLEWFSEALDNSGLQQAFFTSVMCAIGATIIALVLGCLISLAVSRYQWFGRDSISFVILLPIALPGIVTGMALSTTFSSLSVPLGILTVMSVMPRSASSSSTTTRSLGYGGPRAPMRRRQPTSARTSSRRSDM